jgi:hypothetical protein
MRALDGPWTIRPGWNPGCCMSTPTWSSMRTTAGDSCQRTEAGGRVDRQAAREMVSSHTAKVRPTTRANQPCRENAPVPAVAANGPTKLISATGTPIDAVHGGSALPEGSHYDDRDPSNKREPRGEVGQPPIHLTLVGRRVIITCMQFVAVAIICAVGIAASLMVSQWLT